MEYRLEYIANRSDTITSNNIMGDFSYEHNINPDTDLNVGTVASARITLTIDKSSMTGHFPAIGDSYQLKIAFSEETVFYPYGIFNISEIEKKSANIYKLVAYDNIMKLSKNVKEWNDNLNWEQGIDVATYFDGLCRQCDLTPMSHLFTNQSITMTMNPFGGNTLNGRTLMSYIAAVAGGFVVADAAGVIYIKHMSNTTTPKSIPPTKYKELLIANDPAPVINSVKVSVGDGDVGYVSSKGDGTNVLEIPYNAIFYNDNKEDVKAAVDNIYDVVHGYAYTPATLSLFSDLQLNVGDKYTVTWNGGSANSYIFSKKITSSGVEFISTGNAVRASVDNMENEEIQQLVGKYNKIQSDVNGIRVITGDLSQKVEHTMVWDATGATIRDQDGNEVKIDGKSITAGTINAGDINMTGAITWSDLASDTQQKIESAGQVYRQDTVPENPQAGAFWYVTGVTDINVGDITYYAGSWYNFNGTTWEFSNNPKAITHTYIDSYKLISPEIEGNNIKLHADTGGSFSVYRDLQGVETQLGFMGSGTAYINQKLEHGVCLANVLTSSTEQALSVEDNFVIITPSEMRMCFSWEESGGTKYRSIILNSTGGWYEDEDGQVTLGGARFL